MADTRDDARRQRDVLDAIEASFGAWTDRDFDGTTYVAALRRGMAARLDQLQRSSSTRKRGGPEAAPQVRHAVEGC